MSYDNGDWYSLTPSRDKLERLEKANAWYKSVIEKSSKTERQQLFKIKELQDENEILKSKVVDCTKCQSFQEKLKELNSINDRLTTSVQNLLNSHELRKAKLTQRDEKNFVLQKELRLLEEQSEVFHDVQSECDSEILNDTQDNSEKDLILGLQTQLKEIAELVVRVANEKYFVSQENESLKVEIKKLQTQVKETERLKDEIQSLQTENTVLKSKETELIDLEKLYGVKEFKLLEKIDKMKSQVSKLSEKLQILKQKMKQQIILFEEDKRMFLAKNEFLEKDYPNYEVSPALSFSFTRASHPQLHFGNLPQFPLNYESEPGYIENYNSYPYDSSSFPQQDLCCEDCRVLPEADHCQTPQYTVNHPIFNAHNDFLDSQNKITIDQNKIMEQMTSLTSIMGDVDLDTILEKESDEFIKSSVENLVPNPSEFKDECECDVPDCDDSQMINFSIPILSLTILPLVMTSQVMRSEFNPIHNEERDSNLKNNHFDTESYPLESLLNRDILMISSLKIDSLLAEFAGELIFLESIPTGIDEANCDPEEDIHLVERLLSDNSSPRPSEEFVSENSNAEIESFSPSPIPVEDSDSRMEEIDLTFNPDDPMPSSIEDDDYDSERDTLIHEELLDNYSLSLPENESFYFDIHSLSRPPAKPPDGEISSSLISSGARNFSAFFYMPDDDSWKEHSSPGFVQYSQNFKYLMPKDFILQVFISSASIGNHVSKSYRLTFSFGIPNKWP
nr:hypothetical protein [Tanacetum cinerariifolium]